MIRKVGLHFRQQWTGVLALFLVLAGGAAYAATAINGPAPGVNSVGSLDIMNDQVLTADVANDVIRGPGGS